jgi:hypothetical protein
MTVLARKHLLATLLGIGLVLLLLLLASLDNLLAPPPPQRFDLQEVQLYQPPPPPPPPPTTSRDPSQMAGPSLELFQPQVQLELQVMDLAIELPSGGTAGFGGGLGGEGEGLGIDWSLVSLSELDGYPNVLQAPILHWHRQLIEQGVKEINVEFHILIDETGRVHPLRILTNDQPSMNETLLEFAAQVRFTPPTRLGVPVRTEYRWPVRFTSSASQQ